MPLWAAAGLALIFSGLSIRSFMKNRRRQGASFLAGLFWVLLAGVAVLYCGAGVILLFR